MRLLAMFLAVVTAFQFSCFPIAVSAQVSYSSSTGVSGKAPVNKVGALLIADGIAILSATTVAIATSTSSGATQAQLSGNVFKVQQIDANTVRGQSFFNDGPGLDKIKVARSQDRVVTKDGTKIDGRISNITSDMVSIDGRTIPMDQVEEVHSDRVYNFTCKLGEAPKITFSPTWIKGEAPAVTKAPSSSHEHSPITKILVIGGLMAGLACAITLPIVIPLATRNNHRDNNQDALATAIFVNSLRKPPSQPIQPSSSSYGP
ncbi:MAG TPA: hypothetical protein V6D17_01220 [Candidatus Obscuribacterales bacterium]